jgi:tetratricopeptide (TPR) repeat protein
VGAFGGCSSGMAQFNFCPLSGPEVKGLCSSLVDVPAVSAQAQHPEPALSTVTFEELRHVAPKKAQKEKESAEKALERHRQEEAVDHLKTAIRIDPAFIRARNDLAVLYIWMNNPFPAIEQLNEAIKLDPHSSLLFGNLAAGYLATGKFDDAERAARVAVDLDRTGSRAQFILCNTLYYQQKFTEEALRCAERTRDEYPMAHLFAARVFIDRNDFERARGEIRAYLSGNSQEPDLVTYATGWLNFMAAQEQRTAAALH